MNNEVAEGLRHPHNKLESSLLQTYSFTFQQTYSVILQNLSDKLKASLLQAYALFEECIIYKY